LVIMSAPRNHIIKKDLWSFFTFSFTLLPHLKRATHFDRMAKFGSVNDEYMIAYFMLKVNSTITKTQYLTTLG
jgi:hypothetical protein